MTTDAARLAGELVDAAFNAATTSDGSGPAHGVVLPHLLRKELIERFSNALRQLAAAEAECEAWRDWHGCLCPDGCTGHIDECMKTELWLKLRAARAARDAAKGGKA